MSSTYLDNRRELESSMCQHLDKFRRQSAYTKLQAFYMLPQKILWSGELLQETEKSKSQILSGLLVTKGKGKGGGNQVLQRQLRRNCSSQL
jgi:hypothetical protein